MSTKPGQVQSWVVEDQARPWAGEIAYEFAASRMKGTEAFEALLISHADATAPDACADLRTDLLELYFMPGGARDVLLTLPDGSATRSPFVFPAVAAHGRLDRRAGRLANGCMLQPRSLTAAFRQRIEEFGSRAGIDPRRLLNTYGAAAPHVCRALAYTAADRVGQGRAGARLLAHSTGSTTADLHYSAPGGVTPDQIRRAQARATPSPTSSLPESGESRRATLIAEALQMVRTGVLSQDAYAATLRALNIQS